MSEEQGLTVQGWLKLLDNCKPPDEAWRDPDFVQMISWAMVMFIPRRLGQRLIDTGMCEPGSYIRDLNTETPSE